MEDITRKRLEDAGWQPNRIIDINNIEKKYVKIGLKMPDNVKEFLKSFGMLEVIFTKKMQNANIDERIIFDPIAAIGCNLDENYFSELLQEYDISDEVYPIGLASRGNLMMLMAKDNVFYRFTDGFLSRDGKNIEEMLDCVIGECYIPEIIEC